VFDPRERPLLPGLCLAALAVVARAIEAAQQVRLFNDAPRFVEIAEAFAQGDWRAALADSFHPLTSLAMAAVAGVLPVSLEAAGQLVSVVAGGAATFTLWCLARDVFGPRIALATGVLCAVHPRLVASSAGVQSDGLHLALLLAGALAVWRCLNEGSARQAALAGLACGLAYLTRPEGLVVAVAMGLWLLVDLLTQRRALARTLALGASFGAVLILTAAPYVVGLHELTGTWSLTRKKSLWIGADAAPAPPPRHAADSARSEPVGSILATHAHPSAYARGSTVASSLHGLPPASATASHAAGSVVHVRRIRFGSPAVVTLPARESYHARTVAREAMSHSHDGSRGARDDESPSIEEEASGPIEIAIDGLRALHGIVLGLVLLGIARGPALRGTLYLASMCGIVLAVLIALYVEVGYVSRRHWLPAVALLLPFAGRGGLWLLDAVVSRVPALAAWHHARVALTSACVLALVVDAAIPQEDAQKVARREAALWLRAEARPVVVAAHRARDAYFSGAERYVPLEGPPNDPHALLRRARAAGAEYALLDLPLPGGTALPDGWVRELHRAEHRGRAVLVVALAPP
jgi:hypothetical protein